LVLRLIHGNHSLWGPAFRLKRVPGWLGRYCGIVAFGGSVSVFGYALAPNGLIRDEIDFELLSKNLTILMNVFKAEVYFCRESSFCHGFNRQTSMNTKSLVSGSSRVVINGQMIRQVLGNVSTQS